MSAALWFLSGAAFAMFVAMITGVTPDEAARNLRAWWSVMKGLAG